jgi:glutamate racemase
VIGTPTTINSNAYARRMHELDPTVRVYSQACPLFVPLVEEGWLDHEVTRLTAQEYLRPVLAEEVDSLVLGCTHYPLLKPLLRDVAGPRVRLIDSALTTAEFAAERLQQAGLARTAAGRRITASWSATCRCASRPSASASWGVRSGRWRRWTW